MKKMNKEMTSRETSFVVREIDGGGDVAWAQCHRPLKDISELSHISRIVPSLELLVNRWRDPNNVLAILQRETLHNVLDQ